MKKIFKNLLVVIGILFSTSMVLNINSPVYADSDGLGTCREFLPGMVSWDCNIKANPSGEEDLKFNVKQIAVNISKSIAAIATYLMVGYVIYGGYLYIFSSGDPVKATAGKKTLSHAFIGLAIVALAHIIISSAGIAILGEAGAFEGKNCVESKCVEASDLFFNLVNWVIGITGVVSAIFVVIGGIGYMTSAGDPAKLQKAKTTIIYSLIGLAIVGLSLVISNFAVDIINKADSGEDIRDPIVSLLNTIIGILGTVAVIFIVKGGFTYMTSTGDPGKIKKAKDTILYACIGLIVCALAFVIVNWAVRSINSSSRITLPKNDIAFLEKKL